MSGYAIVQSTRPQTLAYALTDSPVGQLAWIVEKFKEWTDPAAELPEDAVDCDRLLTNVSIYWLTATAGSSARLYYEGAKSWGQTNEPSGVPTGVAVFAMDITIRSIAESQHNIVHWSEFDHGGHFAAMEGPDLLGGDVRAFFRPLRRAPLLDRRAPRCRRGRWLARCSERALLSHNNHAPGPQVRVENPENPCRPSAR
jgi:epoxide hydrolase